MSIFMILLFIGLFFPLITLLLSGLFSGLGSIAQELHIDISSLGDSIDLPEGDISDFADISDVSDISDISDVSDVSDVSEISDASDASDGGNDAGGSFSYLSFFPISPLMWSSAFAVTGGVGEILRVTVGLPIWVIFILAAPCGYIVMFSIYNFVFRSLQRVDNSVKNESDLAYSTATVMEAISAGGYGSVRVDGSVGTVTYAAYEVNGLAVPQGAEVWVIRIVNGRAEVQHDSSNNLAGIIN